MSSMAARRAAMHMPKVLYSITSLGAQTKGGNTFPGGLDQVTPALALQPGALIDGVNFECSINGGYGRIAGYERVDGHAMPSSASFVIVQVSSFANVPAVGATITQASSGATGTVAAVNTVAGATYMVVTQISGSFDTSGVVSTSGSLIVTAANSPFTVTAANSPYIVTAGATVGTAIPTAVSITALLSAQYTAAAADILRSFIQAVPGSGDVLGVVSMVFSGTDNLYAFRANLAGTAVNLYRSSSIGWVQVPFFNVVEFTAGAAAIPADGDTLIQGAVTATIKRIMQRSGADAWSGDAAGGFVITNPSGGNFAAGAATTSSGATVTLSGAPTSIVLQPGGHFEFDKNNFGGQLQTRRIYGVDGANKLFEFDGTTLAPISTGLSDDRPNHVAAHKGFLFVSFGSSALYSAPGLPFRWNALDGGGEIACGDDVTGMITLPGNQSTATLAIYQTSNTSFLYGTDKASWQLITYNTGVGARPFSVKNLFDSFAFDDFGVVTLQSTLNFGNFASSTLTRNIMPFILRERSTLVTATINRAKGQYRVFFRDGYGLYLTVSNQTYLGAIPVLFPNPVRCCDEDKNSSGEEVGYFGSSNGFVYQMDKGPSFDGADVYAFITLAWDALKSPRLLKRFRAMSIEVQGTSYASINVGYQLGYGTPSISQPSAVAYPTSFAPAPTWDSFVWDNFIWDGKILSPTDADMTGTAENVQVTIQSGTNYIAAYQVNSTIYHYSARRGLRV